MKTPLLLALGFGVTLAVAMSGCKTTSPQGAAVKEGGGRPVGEFLGAPALQQALVENLFDQTDLGTKQFQLSRVLGDGIDAQKTLLGGNDTDGDRFDFRGGVPNPLGVLLWYKTMKSLAATLGTVCAQAPTDRVLNLVRSKQKPVLRTDFHATVRKICDAPPTEVELNQMWKFVIGFGQDDEKTAYKDQFKANAEADGAKRVEAIALTLLMNPSFLLQQ